MQLAESLAGAGVRSGLYRLKNVWRVLCIAGVARDALLPLRLSALASAPVLGEVVALEEGGR